MFFQVVVLKNFVIFTEKNLFFNKVDSKDTKEAPTQVFPCEYCEGFKNIFFTEHLRWLLLVF